MEKLLDSYPRRTEVLYEAKTLEDIFTTSSVKDKEEIALDAKDLKIIAKQTKKILKAFDYDNSNSLSFDESLDLFREFYREATNVEMLYDAPKDFFDIGSQSKIKTKDRNGKVVEETFTDLVSRAFKYFDSNKDLKWSLSELLTMQQKWYYFEGARAIKFMNSPRFQTLS